MHGKVYWPTNECIIYKDTDDGDSQERANTFVKDVKSNPEVWRLCCERFSSSTYTEIKFWCLQTLQEARKQHVPSPWQPCLGDGSPPMTHPIIESTHWDD